MKSIVEHLNEALNESVWSLQDLEDYCEMYITPTVEKMGGEQTEFRTTDSKYTSRYVVYEKVSKQCVDKLVKELNLSRVGDDNKFIFRPFEQYGFHVTRGYDDKYDREKYFSKLFTTIGYDESRKMLLVCLIDM